MRFKITINSVTKSSVNIFFWLEKLKIIISNILTMVDILRGIKIELSLTEFNVYLQKYNDRLEEGEEDKDNTSTHPNIKSRDIAEPGSVMPDWPEHGGQGEEGGHGHGNTSGDGLGGKEEREPGYNHKQTWNQNPIINGIYSWFSCLKEDMFEAGGSLFFFWVLWSLLHQGIHLQNK